MAIGSNTGIGWTYADSTPTVNNTNAVITYNGVTYDIPRVGYPILTQTGQGNKSYIPSGLYFAKMGLMGTFDGQGHIISNLDTQRTSAPTVKQLADSVETDADTLTRYTPGIFGVLGAATIKNVAVDNPHLYDDPSQYYGSIFALLAQKSSIATARTHYENIYVYSDSTHTGGTLHRYALGSTGNSYKNVVINMPNLKATTYNADTSKLEGCVLGQGGRSFAQTGNSGLDNRLDGVFIVTNATTTTKVDGVTTEIPFETTITLNLAAKAQNESNGTYKIAYAYSLEELFNKENIYAGQTQAVTKNSVTTNVTIETITMLERLKDNPYWTAVDSDNDGTVDAVYWKGLEPQA